MKIRIQAKDTRIFALAAASPLPTPATENPLPEAIVWMPAGRHAISAGTLDGTTFTGSVVCDEQAARAISSSFTQIQSSGQRVWLDFDHEDGEAAAWVKSFSWDPGRGILAQVEWTPKGAEAVRGKSYYSFSPAFEAEGRSGRVLGLIAGHAAGGLVNAPAFGAAMPALIAARMAHLTTNGGNSVTPIMKELLVKLLAAMAITAPADATEETLVSLIAKQTAEAHKSTAEVEALKKEIAAAQAAAKTTSDTLALQAKKAQEEKDALAKELGEVRAVQAALSARGNGSVTVTSQDLVDLLASYAGKDPAQLPAHERFANAREELARERAGIWAKHFSPFVRRESLYDLVCLAEQRSVDVRRVAAKNVTGPVAIFAANNLGTLTGSLITQQSLSLLKADLPALDMFTTDFSPAAAKLSQTIITRTRGIPAVQSYVPNTGYVSGGTATADIPVTINAHQYVQFEYNVSELGSTNRDLFGEQAEGAIYALGKDMLDTSLTLFTPANYNLPTQKSVVAQANFNRSAIVAQQVALRKRKVQAKVKFALCNEDYFGTLSEDPSIVSLATFQRPEIITDYVLPNVAGFRITGYVDLPATSNLAAVFGTKEALIIAARLPYDYVDAQAGASNGVVSQITDPNTGLSVMLVQWVSHDAGASKYRVALMYGSAIGDKTRAQLVLAA